MQVVVVGDKIVERFALKLMSISGREAKIVFMRSLNEGGNKARTQVSRSLVQQTGIKRGLVNKALATVPATPVRLEYALTAIGDETSLGLYNAVQRKKGVSAAPWRTRRLFPGSFMIGAKPGDRAGSKSRTTQLTRGTGVYVRLTKERGPLGMLWGPNIAREIVKEPTVNEWQKAGPFVLTRVEHHLGRLLSRR